MLAIQTNCIPILGKFIQLKLLTLIITNKPPKVYITLDQDAYNNAILLAKTLSNLSINTYITKFPKDTDPGLLGFNKAWLYINNSELFNKRFLMNNMFKRQ